MVQLPEKAPKRVLCSCVLYAKWLAGREDEFWGTAKYIKANIPEPEVGDFILTRESAAGHVAYIWLITDDGYFVREANYIPCREGERFIPKESRLIRGFYRPTEKTP